MRKNSQINRTFLIILLGILAAIGPFSIDMYLPGFKQIAADFSTAEQDVAFTLTSYFIGIAIGQLYYGPIIDKHGRKKPLIIGLIIYMLASIGCAVAPSLFGMIGVRFIQALGGCVGMVAANAIVSDVYESNKRAKAFSLIVLVMGIAPLIAPSVGSYLLLNFGWRYIFYFLAAFSLTVSLLIYFFLPETSRYIHKNKLIASKIAKDYIAILKNKTFLLYTISGSLVMSNLFAYISSAAAIFLTHFELDEKTFSFIFAINASGFISGSYLNGVLTKYVHYIKIARTASWLLAIVVASAFLLLYFFPHVTYPWVVACLFSILFISGFINPNVTAGSFAPFQGNVGSASALGGSFRMAFGAFVAFAVGISNASLTTLFGIMLVIALLVLLSTIKAPKLD